MAVENVAACTNVILPVCLAIGFRHDEEMVIGHEEREVGIASVQFEHNTIRPVLRDLLDRCDVGLGRGFGLFAAVMVDRGDDIVCRHRLAVGELDALAKVEDPSRRVVIGFPGFCHVADEIPVRVDLGQGVVGREAERHHIGVGIGLRVEGIGCAALGKTDAKPAALLGRIGAHRPRTDHRQRRAGHAECCRTRQEFTPSRSGIQSLARHGFLPRFVQLPPPFRVGAGTLIGSFECIGRHSASAIRNGCGSDVT